MEKIEAIKKIVYSSHVAESIKLKGIRKILEASTDNEISTLVIIYSASQEDFRKWLRGAAIK